MKCYYSFKYIDIVNTWENTCFCLCHIQFFSISSLWNFFAQFHPWEILICLILFLWIFFFNFAPGKYEFVSILSLIIMHFRNQIETNSYFLGTKLKKKITKMELDKFIFLKDEIGKKNHRDEIEKKLDMIGTKTGVFFSKYFKARS